MVILLFGATGSAGNGVLSVCLADPAVKEVRAILRRPIEEQNGKLRQFPHADFLDFAAVRPAFVGVDVCLYCLGISTTQVPGEPQYRRVTHDYAIAAATMLKSASPNAGFQFLSAEGASPTSRFRWCRVKFETERDLLPIVNANAFRPTYIDGRGSPSEPKMYKLYRPILRRVLKPFPQLYVHATEIGRAMLKVTRLGLSGEVIHNRRIRELAS